MKKKSSTLQRGLSVLLCLCMLFSLVPAGAASIEGQEGPTLESQGVPDGPQQTPMESDEPMGGPQPEDSAESPFEADETPAPEAEGTEPADQAEPGPPEETEAPTETTVPFSSEVPLDGAVEDVWEQDPSTVKGAGAICGLEGDKLHLKSGDGNGNNADPSKDCPAAFIDRTASAAFADANGEDRFFEATFEQVSSKTNTQTGVYINYNDPGNAFFVGYDSGGWFWQTYSGNNGAYHTGARVAAPGPGVPVTLRLEWNGTSLTKATANGVDLFGTEPLDFSAADSSVPDRIAIKAGRWGGESADLYLSNVHYTNQATQTAYSVAGKVLDETGAPIPGATVQVGGNAATTDETGAYVLDGAACLLPGTYEMSVSAEQYQTKTVDLVVTDADLEGQDVSLAPIPVVTLSTDALDIVVDTTFPRVIRYTVKGGSADGKVLYGQTEQLDTITINGIDVRPVVTAEPAESGDRIAYTMAAVDQEHDIDCVVYAELVAEGKTLSFNIERIDNALDEIESPVERISIPDHSLISVRSDQAGAALIGNRLAANTITSGDFRYAADELGNADGQRFIYGFVYNDEVSAGIASNSEWGADRAAFNNHRVIANAEDRGSHVSLGLSSSEWYYDRRVSSSDADPTNNAVIPDAQKAVGPTELPLYAKVVVTGDENGDADIDWQDAAIVARDTIVHKPFRSDEIRDLVTTRIVLNFGSQAQNPFLTTLDNAKRVYLNTDGLGQSILLKGYGNEGHDSGHGDYADVGTRMGGVPDMLTMMREGADLGARFGIHVNASEFYPESKAFSDKTVRRNSSGDLHYGWNWLDQGVGINGLYDLASGNRRARFDALGDEMEGLLDFIYVDVWGNYTSGNSEDAWQTRKLSKELTDNGWRVTQEWGYANEWDSTFQHWVADYTYGEYDNKGKYNSEVERFLLNSYKDTFVADYPRYGGNANAPLLGGAAMQGFEGWQGDGEYDEHVESIFEHQIPAKFLQHYDIMEWVDAAGPVTMPWFSKCDDNKTSGTTEWTPEVKITLQDADREDTVVVTRGTDPDAAASKDFAYDTDAEKQEYRARTITLNGREILRGTPAPATNLSGQWGGDLETQSLRGLANQQYLIPWLWDVDGSELAADEQKLYHRNDLGGESDWELPAGWEDLATVKMYELTDNGRVNETVVPVTDGSVTLYAEARAPYVIVKGDAASKAPTVEWSTGLYLRDVGFNSTSVGDHWAIAGAGTAVRYLNQDDLSVLKMTGAVSVSQEYDGLAPGHRYVTYVSVDNRSDAKASMTVTDAGGQVLASNYTELSIAKNYISGYSINTNHPIEGGSSKFQNMYVTFIAPADGKATLTLERAAGEGNTYFDDVRTLETKAENLTFDSEGNLIKFSQDFEHVAQGEYPFVVGPGSGGVQDNYQHLSERHDPYTSAGWNVRILDDVLDGNWSLKLGDRNSRTDLALQTIPQNFRFEPGVTYSVRFDYQMGTDQAYEVITGVGEWGTGSYTVAASLKESRGTTATCKFTVVGDPSGQTWIGIRGTGVSWAASGSNADIFAGYRYFVLDDLVIEVSSAQKAELAALIAQADGMAEDDYTGDWSAFQAALAAAQAVMNDPKTTQSKVDAAAQALDTAIKALAKVSAAIGGTVTSGGVPVAGAVIILEDATTSSLPVGASAVTDAEGRYLLEDLSVKDYQLRVSAGGYEVQTVPVTGLVADTVGTKDISLTVQSPAPYTNTFDTGDVSMLVGLGSADTTFTLEPVQYNGSGAVKIHFTGNRNTNNVVDKSLKLKNGTFSYDVTPLDTGARFGADVRANSVDSRTFLGLFDDISRAGCEYWFNSANWYPSGSLGPAFAVNVTRHVEIEMREQHLTMKVDGVTTFDSDVPAASDLSGYVGFVFGHDDGSSDASFIIDNMSIAPADAPAAGTYAISGTVTDEAGAPLAGAQVTVSAGDAAVARASTGVDGAYVTLPLSAGDYTVEISAPGYGTATRTVTVSDAAVSGCDAVLAVDASQLQALYDAHKGDEQGDYTDASWAAFQAALAQAAEALAHPSAATVPGAYSALTNAIKGLTEKPVDKSLLRTYHNAFKTYASSDYTAGSWSAFQAALQAASAVLDDVSAKQAQVDEACAALVAAEKALVKTGSGSSGGSGGNTKTETIKNEDGSTTKRVTDKKTGAVTETTTWPDGTKVVVKTGQDGPAEVEIDLPKGNSGKADLSITPLPEDSIITVESAKPVAVTIPVKGAKPGLVAVLVKADGTKEIVRRSITGSDSISLALSGSATFQLVDNSRRFHDMPTDHWASDAAAFVSSRELFQGVGADRFAPDLDMTRAMLVTVLNRLENEPSAGLSGFHDVEDDAWYSMAVGWASENSIVLGTGDGFQPNGSITREALAAMLYRYATHSAAVLPSDGKPVSSFVDGGTVSPWAADAMDWAVGAGIITGKDGGRLDPGGTASRAEVAVMLERFVRGTFAA